MDESTYGESTLRSMRETKRQSKSRNRPYLNFSLIWQITVFTSISTLTSLFFINKVMTPFSTNNINIQGENLLTRANIIQAMKLKLPLFILEINPKELERKLKANLPIKSVAIDRRIIPLGIDIKILEMKPIASALKVGEDGQEKGMIDKEGNWIPSLNANRNILGGEPLVIDGWTKRNRTKIAFILKYQNKLDLPLKRIIFAPDGNISLQSQDFLFIHLGNQPSLLSQQLEVVAHLSKNLQNEISNGSETILDLKNPSKPKLFLEKKLE